MDNITRYKNCFVIKKNKRTFIINMRNKLFWEFDNDIYLNDEYCDSLPEAVEERLIYDGIIEENNQPNLVKIDNEEYLPILGTFLMSSICNLNCKYCYAYNNESIMLEYETGKKGVDFLIENARKKRVKQIVVKFHGIGEPTINFKEMRNIYDYADKRCKEEGLVLKSGITTNGICSNEVRQWMNENLDNITISFDGFKEVQNVQRPHNTLNSFDEVMSTIMLINKEKISIRTTVTELNVEILSEWVEFLNDKGIKRINFEPVIICGRAKTEKIQSLKKEDFVDNYLKAKQKGREINVEVSFSGIKYNKNTRYHCGAYGRNFVITPNGLISTCYEIAKLSNTDLDKFIIGNFEDEKIYIAQDKVYLLKEFSHLKRMQCQGCFAEFNCSGGCISKKVIKDEIIEESVKIKCEITKEILLDEIITVLENSLSH